MRELYKDLGDLDLMTLVTSGDREAFAEIYRRYKRSLYLHAFRMLENEEEAKDVLQEVFAAVWSKRHTITLETSLTSYLFQSVKYRILNLISQKKTETRYLESLAQSIEEGENITEEEVRGRELEIQIEKEIALLPSKMRTVFELASQQHLSYQEIALALGISDKTVKKQVHKARSILRNKLTSLVIAWLLFW